MIYRRIFWSKAREGSAGWKGRMELEGGKEALYAAASPTMKLNLNSHHYFIAWSLCFLEEIGKECLRHNSSSSFHAISTIARVTI